MTTFAAGKAHLEMIAAERAAQAQANAEDRRQEMIEGLAVGQYVWNLLPDDIDPADVAAQSRHGVVVRIFVDEDSGLTDVTIVETIPCQPRPLQRWQSQRHVLRLDEIGEVRLLGSAGQMGKAAALFHLLADHLGSTWTEKDERTLRWALTLRDVANPNVKSKVNVT